MLKHDSRLDFVQEKYFFDQNGVIRKRVDPLQIDPSSINKKILGLIRNSKVTCFIGDSVTEGTENGFIPWFEPIEYLFPSEIVNCSKGSITTKIFLQHIETISKITADLFIIAIGTNDVRYRNEKICAMTKENYVENLQILRDSISKNNPDCKFIFIAPWISTDGDKISALKYRDKIAMNLEYTAELKNWCEKNSDLFVDTNIYIDKFLKQYPHSKYMVDWIHPNGRDGVRLYSEAFLKSQ